ncbi:MAG TPA: AAA family ATPase [Abditibacteriaceae bacterium]|jgi:predicted kinase
MIQHSPQVAILIGLQGAGKSTFYRIHLAATHLHISKDNFRHAKSRDKRQQTLLRDALQEGRSAAIDNTNPAVADRVPLMEIAQEFHAPTVAYYFQPALAACLERNRGREGVARVPDIALFATLKKLQAPSLAEGFDAIFHVCNLEDGSFEITSQELPAQEQTS